VGGKRGQVSLIHDPGFFARQGHGLALSYQHFDLPQFAYDLLRCKSLFRHFPVPFCLSVSIGLVRLDRNSRTNDDKNFRASGSMTGVQKAPTFAESGTPLGQCDGIEF
jgi:hypothetical protein